MNTADNNPANLRNLPPDKRREFSEKGNRNRRSTKHQWAYDNKEVIRKESEYTKIPELARKYEVSNRTIRRWIEE